MILIFGGTTEGRLAAGVLDEAGKTFYYSTRGHDSPIDTAHGILLCGARTVEEIIELIRLREIRVVIDAAHPFAPQVHQTIVRAAKQTGVPTIRFERIYPPRDKRFIYCSDYPDAINRLESDGIRQLLMLTGVQTIARLRPYWVRNPDSYFRILDRDSSRSLAAREGFPSERLCYFTASKEAEVELLNRLNPQAILTKESGESGFFGQKTDAALARGVQVYVIARPPLPGYTRTADGTVGLRRAVEQLVPDFFPQRTGLTTGSAATAAAKAALLVLLGYEKPTEVVIRLPKSGERVSLPIDKVEGAVGNCSRATVIKDGGDDPDVTHGTAVIAEVCFVESRSAGENLIRIDGGEGIGRITLPGIGLPIGSAAINPTPRAMISRELSDLAPGRAIDVVISAPEGRELAKRTFNPRLGIIDGISIIGTGGQVKPFSSEAFVASIRRGIDVALAVGSPRIVLNSGGKSEHALKALYPDLPAAAFIQYGNFIGETFRLLADLRCPYISIGIMIGKAVKLAEGILDTHSRKGTMNKSFLQGLAAEAGCSVGVHELIREMTMARELLENLSRGDKQRFIDILTTRCLAVCRPLVPDAEVALHLIE